MSTKASPCTRQRFYPSACPAVRYNDCIHQRVPPLRDNDCIHQLVPPVRDNDCIHQLVPLYETTTVSINSSPCTRQRLYPSTPPPVRDNDYIHQLVLPVRDNNIDDRLVDQVRIPELTTRRRRQQVVGL